MTTLRFLHCSDLHLDSPLDGLERYPGAPVDALRGATRAALENLVELAIARRVAFVVIAGDLFDGDWRDVNTGLFFNAQMLRLGRHGIRVYLKRGNHDAASEITRALAAPDNVFEFPTGRAHTFRIDELGVALHGRSFADRAVPEDLAAGYPAPVPGCFNIGVLHTSLGGYAAHDPYAPTTLDTLRARGYDYWALGHVHAREVLQVEAPRIVYCGNLQGRHAGETGPKGCELVEVVAGEVRAEPVELDVLRWSVIALPIDGLAEVSDFRRAAERAMRDAHDAAGGRLSAWRLRVVGAGPLHRWLSARPDEAHAELRSVANLASDGRAWVEKIVTACRPPADAPRPGPDDPLHDCLALAAELRADPDALGAFSADAMRDLLPKLPAPLRAGPQSLGLEDPRVLAGLLAEAESLLLERLAEDTR
ncbi:MAG: DNA repair exonuclease [Burkholderiales bacterium]